MRVKRGEKLHYIHHLKERDGSSRPVHLGTDAHEANKRLIKLKKERLDHRTKLNSDIEKLQRKLNSIVEHGRPIDHKLADIKKTHYKHKMFDNMLAKHIHDGKTEQAVIITTLVVCASIFFLYLFGNPTITGNVILNADVNSTRILTSPMTGSVLTGLLVVALGATIIHSKFHMVQKK